MLLLEVGTDAENRTGSPLTLATMADAYNIRIGGYFDAQGTVKRMYTRPAARGRGIAKALLRRIEHQARATGKIVLRLETGIRQQEAIGLYERMGFRSRGPFGPYATISRGRLRASVLTEIGWRCPRCLTGCPEQGSRQNFLDLFAERGR